MAKVMDWAEGIQDLNPMLATEASMQFLRRLEGSPEGEYWQLEIKFDGIRIIAYWSKYGPVLRTRRGNNIAESFPEICAQLEHALRDQDDTFVLDGELVAHPNDKIHKPLYVQKRNHVTNPSKLAALQRDFPAEYIAFDMLAMPYQLVVGDPLKDRREHLDRLARNNAQLVVTDTYKVENVDRMWDFVQKNRLEGLVAKRKESKYRFERSNFWRKIKF